MTWTVGYVGGTKRSEKEFEREEDALEEYHLRLERYGRAKRNSRNKDPPKQVRRAWIAPTGDDGLTLYHGVVQQLIPRKGYSIVMLCEPLQGEALQYYWYDGQRPLKPGDEIMYDHEVDPFPRRESLFAICVAE